MTKQSQEAWVRAQLLKNGKITRNECLRRYISRCSAYICNLQRTGMKIEGAYKKTKNGRDFVYTLVV